MDSPAHHRLSIRQLRINWSSVISVTTKLKYNMMCLRGNFFTCIKVQTWIKLTKAPEHSNYFKTISSQLDSFYFNEHGKILIRVNKISHHLF